MSGQLSLFKGKRQRGVKPKPAKEFATHVMIADVLRKWQTPGWRWTHLPFGEHRNAITGARLKRMGTQVGWPDFILLKPLNDFLDGPQRCHFLELKRQGVGLTEFQQSFKVWCDINDFPYAWCDNFNAALAQLKEWGAVRAQIG